MSESMVRNKSFEFDVKTINFYRKFSFENQEYVSYKQLLSSRTSVGANLKEALNRQSKMDFIQKFSIAQKEM